MLKIERKMSYDTNIYIEQQTKANPTFDARKEIVDMDTYNCETPKYRVEGYDKDHDVYVAYWEGDDLEKAKEIATVLDRIAEEDELIRYASDMSKEPIDWVQVTDRNDAMVFLPRNQTNISM